MEAKSSANLIDTHAHLASKKFRGTVDGVLERARRGGVSRILTISCDLEDSVENLRLADLFPSVTPVIGIHPLYVHEPAPSNDPDTRPWIERLRNFAGAEGVAALGEIGLDYYHPPQDGSTEKEWKSLQREFFEAQLNLAQELDLPVVIHQRESTGDVTEVLAGFPAIRAVLHCFSGTPAEADAFLEMGHFLSYTGILTYPNASAVRETARATPLDRVMLETDCPYLAPVPFRGKTCEPSMLAHTASVLAGIHDLSEDEMAALTSRNAREFFRLAPDPAPE